MRKSTALTTFSGHYASASQGSFEKTINRAAGTTRKSLMKRNTNSKYPNLGRLSLATALFLAAGALTVFSYDVPAQKQAAQKALTAGTTSIQSLLEQSAAKQPHVAALLRAISDSIPSFGQPKAHRRTV